MKKVLIASLTLVAMTTAPAHAINAQYRAQLERSGCNEMNAGKGCDIHKTKAENTKNAVKHTPNSVNESNVPQYVKEAENIINLKGIAAEEYLIERGWRQQADGDWEKGAHLMRVIEDKKGFVANAQIIK